MRFLVVFVAVLGYASANLISPYLYGNVQAAAIDSSVAANDRARNWGENQARAAEAAIQWNAEANRQAIDTSRNIHENSYWGSVAANQNAVAAAQSAAAANVGIGAGYLGSPLGLGLGSLGLGGIGLAPYGINGLGLGLGYRGW